MSLLTSFNGSGCVHPFLHLETIFFVLLRRRMESYEKKHLKMVYSSCQFFFQFGKHIWEWRNLQINIHIMAGMDYRSSDFLGFNTKLLTLIYSHTSIQMNHCSGDSLFVYRFLMDFAASFELMPLAAKKYDFSDDVEVWELFASEFRSSTSVKLFWQLLSL